MQGHQLSTNVPGQEPHILDISSSPISAQLAKYPEFCSVFGLFPH